MFRGVVSGGQALWPKMVKSSTNFSTIVRSLLVSLSLCRFGDALSGLKGRATAALSARQDFTAAWKKTIPSWKAYVFRARRIPPRCREVAG